MWSVEDDAFIATVVELPKCQAKGKTVVEAMNHLEAAIEEWIETAKKMGQAIPEPFYSEPSWKEQHHDHEHDFSSVVSFLLGKPSFCSSIALK